MSDALLQERNATALRTINRFLGFQTYTWRTVVFWHGQLVVLCIPF